MSNALEFRRPKWTRDGWLGRLRHAIGWCPRPHFEAHDRGGVLRLGLLSREGASR